MAGFANAARALGIRNYRLYTAGNAVSLIGSWMQRVAVGWLAWQLTHSTVWLGLVAVGDLLPTFVLSPLAGVLADRVDRVRLIWLTQVVAMAQAALLALLTVAGVITVGWLLLLTVALGVVNAFNQPARLALIPSLVDRDNLGAAVAINSLVFNGARFLGPAAAGLIIDRGSVGLAFSLNAASYLAFMAALARLRLAPGAAAAPRAPRRRALIGDTFAGYAYALRHPGIGRIIALFAVSTLSLRGFVELFPGFADTVFGRGANGLAWLTAMLGLGAVVGGAAMLRRPGIQGLSNLVFRHTLIMAVAALAFVATRNYWFALACLFVAGFSLVSTGIAAQTLIQNAVDPAMRGRVLGLYGMLFRGGAAFNALFMGWLSSLIGLRPSIAAGAILCIAYWTWARLDRERMTAALEAEAHHAAAE